MCLVISGISSSNSSTLLKVIKQWLAHVPIIKKAIYSPFHSDCQAKIQQLPPIYQTLPQDFELLHQFLHFYQDKWRVLQTATVLTQTKNFYTKTSFFAWHILFEFNTSFSKWQLLIDWDILRWDIHWFQFFQKVLIDPLIFLQSISAKLTISKMQKLKDSVKLIPFKSIVESWLLQEGQYSSKDQ